MRKCRVNKQGLINTHFVSINPFYNSLNEHTHHHHLYQSHTIMIFSSPFSPPSLLISKPNQPNKSSFLSPFSLPSPSRTSPSPKATMASSTFPSSSLPPTLTLPSPKSSSFYDVLGIPMGATIDEIKIAYRKLARVCHPDVAPKDAPADEFIRIHAAYSTLADPAKRADYDHRILRSSRRFTTLRTSPAGGQGPVYSRRKWETDQCW